MKCTGKLRDWSRFVGIPQAPIPIPKANAVMSHPAFPTVMCSPVAISGSRAATMNSDESMTNAVNVRT